MEQTAINLRRELEERLRFETLLTEISARFVNLPSEQIDGAIEDAQRQICECLGLDLSALWQWSGETRSFLTVTHLYSPPEGPSRPEGIDAAEAFPWNYKKLLNGETLAYSTEQLPPEAAQDRESRRHFGIKSSVAIPLSAGGGPLVGVVSFDTLKEERSWPQEIVKRLTLVAQIFSNALARKRSDEILRKSEARLGLAADSAGAGLWELDCITRTFWATERARAIFGYDPEEVISMERFEASIHPEDLERIRQAIARAFDKGEPVDVEYRITGNNRTLKWISSRGRPYFNTAGEPHRLLGVSLDISRRKRMENALNEQLLEIEKLKLQLENENVALRQELRAERGFDKIIGDSKALNSILYAAKQVASTDAIVLILGETGTGKSMVANAIHQMSNRKNRPLITVNCSALAPSLIESELFGREKGAFTGAHARQAGRFEAAHGGTIFLDEIGEMPLVLQSKLLRVLQEGEFERLGSTKTVRVNVRVIAATSRDLKREVHEMRFREDLFYRLNVFPILIPPLRERIEDIPQLARYFMKKYAHQMGKQIGRIPEASIKMFQDYDWPGNVRELMHIIERGMIISSGNTFKLIDHLRSCPANDSQSEILKDLATIEREHILMVLRETKWRIEGPSGAASILKLHPSTLRSRIKKLNIHRQV